MKLYVVRYNRSRFEFTCKRDAERCARKLDSQKMMPWKATITIERA